MRRLFQCAALTSLLVFRAAASDAQPVVRQVLMLQSLDRGDLVQDQFTGDFRDDLDRRAGNPVNVVQVVIGPTGFAGASDEATVNYIQSTFADRRRPDLILTLGAPAAVFARKHREQLFPGAPVLFAGVDQRFLRDTPLRDDETAVASSNDIPRVVETILHVLPETRQVFVVMGAGLYRQIWRPELEREFGRFQDRLTVAWSDDLSLAEVLRRSANLPRRSVIFFLTFGSDAQGGSYTDQRVLANLHAVANAPLFGIQSVYLGHGIVGGTLNSIEDLVRSTADVAIRLLNGTPPASIRVPPLSPGALDFDWRELQRWDIPESRLPPGSVVRYRPPSLWQASRGTVLSALAVLVTQSLLIAGLVYQRRARQRAEIDSRKNLALAADATRRQTMSALTSSIAHELGQPLSSMINNAEALQMMVAANRATPDTIGEILGDIQTQGLQATQIIDRHRTMLRSRQLDMRPIDLRAVIHESLALVDHDLRARQIEVTLKLSPNPCVISGDHVLLEQVLVNLVVNAMDAMAGTPPLRRRLTISTAMRDDVVEVSVRDSGTGVPPEIVDTLFTPFTTTKSHGLGIGLTIVRTILDVHGGTIAVCNNHEGGATFIVTLLRSEAAGIESGLSGAA